MLDRANQFASSMMSVLEKIPGSNGMEVMKDVIDLDNGIKRDVIVRSVTIRFWHACMKFLNSARNRPKLYVLGTPGIGKTTGIAFPIRILLKQGKTVVYHKRWLLF
jgi:hypothetical protein